MKCEYQDFCLNEAENKCKNCIRAYEVNLSGDVRDYFEEMIYDEEEEVQCGHCGCYENACDMIDDMCPDCYEDYLEECREDEEEE